MQLLPREVRLPRPLWSTTLRFNGQRDAATSLYVVYDDTKAFNGLGPVNRPFIIKYSHLFDVLR